MATRYLILLRGINVGGRNKVPMAALRELLESHGHTNVSTYIASGNVILSSDRTAAAIKRELEEALPKTFKLDSKLNPSFPPNLETYLRPPHSERSSRTYGSFSREADIPWDLQACSHPYVGPRMPARRTSSSRRC